MIFAASALEVLRRDLQEYFIEMKKASDCHFGTISSNGPDVSHTGSNSLRV